MLPGHSQQHSDLCSSALSLAPHSANSQSLLSQGHTLINTSGLMSFSGSRCMCTYRSFVNARSHAPRVCVSPDARDYRVLIRGWVQWLHLTHYEHINFQSNCNHMPFAVHVHTQTRGLRRRHTHTHTCSWYSMPIDNVLMRMAIMIPLLKYLLPTIRSSLVRSPAQQRL